MHNNFKSRLLAGEFLVGTFQKTPSMMVAEVLAKTELDAVCLDAEHSPFDRKDIDGCLLAFRAEQKPSLVRVASSSPEQILNALDCGATGIVAPHIDSVEKAQAIAKASIYGDAGRGYAGSTRAALYIGRSIEQNLAHNASENVVIAQIEDLAALDVIDKIAAVEGIDCLFIGMADLAVALGCKSLTEHRRTGIFVPNLGHVATWRDLGVSLFLLESEHAFIKNGAKLLLDKTKS